MSNTWFYRNKDFYHGEEEEEDEDEDDDDMEDDETAYSEWNQFQLEFIVAVRASAILVHIFYLSDITVPFSNIGTVESKMHHAKCMLCCHQSYLQTSQETDVIFWRFQKVMRLVDFDAFCLFLLLDVH